MNIRSVYSNDLFSARLPPKANFQRLIKPGIVLSEERGGKKKETGRDETGVARSPGKEGGLVASTVKKFRKVCFRGRAGEGLKLKWSQKGKKNPMRNYKTYY